MPFNFEDDFALDISAKKVEPITEPKEADLFNFEDFTEPKPVEKQESKQEASIYNIAPAAKQVEPITTEIELDVKADILQKHVELVEWFDEHYYKIDDEVYYPSVTTILNAYPNKLMGIMNWRGEVGNFEATKQLQEAGEAGSYIHNMMTEMLMGKRMFYRTFPGACDEDFEVIKDQKSFVQIYRIYQFFKVVKPRVIMNEMKLFSKTHQIAGSTDLLLEIKDGHYMIDGGKPIYLPAGLYIADLKTSNYLHEEYWCQVAAYSKMLEECFPQYHIRGNLILHTKSTNKLGIEGFGCKVILDDSPKNIDNYFEDFLKVYECWKLNPSPRSPKIFNFPKEFKLQIGEF